MTDSPDVHAQERFAARLLALPGSYAGPTATAPAPYALLGVGDGAAAAHIARVFTDRLLAASGSQVLLSGAAPEAAEYAAMTEVAGAALHWAQRGEPQEDIPPSLGFLVPGDTPPLLATYALAQYAAHACGESGQAERADTLLRELAAACAPQVQDNPARELAWALWGRTPLLIAAPEDFWLAGLWQELLGRVGKSLSVPVWEPLSTLAGGFEARHEQGDGHLALLLGELDPGDAALLEELLETRVDEVHALPYPGGEDDYAGRLALWYFGLWVAHYLAERYGVSPEDSAPARELRRARAGDTGAPDASLDA